MSNLITKLDNPKTTAYLNLKKYVLSVRIPWFYREDSIPYDVDNADGKYFNTPIYGHTFLARPSAFNNKIARENSSELPLASQVFLEIFEHNNININYFLRINANSVHPQQKVLETFPHVDHFFEHKNILIYLTDSGGETIVGDESYDPKEDDIIIFGGEEHHHKTPKKNRRVVLVATFN